MIGTKIIAMHWVTVMTVQDSQGIVFYYAFVFAELIHRFLLFIDFLVSLCQMITFMIPAFNVTQLHFSRRNWRIHFWSVIIGLVLFFHDCQCFFAILDRLTDESIRLCAFNIIYVEAPEVRFVHGNAAFLYFLKGVVLFEHFILLDFRPIEHVGKMFFIGLFEVVPALRDLGIKLLLLSVLECACRQVELVLIRMGPIIHRILHVHWVHCNNFLIPTLY